MEAVYPGTASALARGRRLRRAEPRLRHRTTPVTFAEIKEVDEEACEVEACEERCVGGAGARRRPDVLQQQFDEFRRRRARRRGASALREGEQDSPPASPSPCTRARSEPDTLHLPAPARDT